MVDEKTKNVLTDEQCDSIYIFWHTLIKKNLKI